MWTALLALALAGPEEDPTPEVGLPIAGVTLEAPRGGLPEESLEALLRARQGERYDPQLVRLDLTTLFRVGDFANVEAYASPWVAYDADGEQVPAVNLTYRVFPAPRVTRVHVQGHQSFSTRKVLDATALNAGQVFYPDLDTDVVRERVLGWYRRQGYVNVEVEVDPLRVSRDTWEVWVRIFEGEPNTLRTMTFVGDIPEAVGEPALQRWARRSGLVVGKPVSQEAIREAQFAMRANLARVTGGLLRPPHGWISARVSPAVTRDDSGDVTVTWAIEPGPRLELAVNGLRWRPAKKVRDALGIDERVRLTRGFIDEAPERLEASLAREGYFAASAVVELRGGSDAIQTLLVEVDRGPRHALRAQPPRKSVQFQGNTALTDAELVRVVDQASEDVIRLDYFTHDELDRGLSAIRDVYRTRGYQEVSLRLADLGNRPVGTRLTRPLARAWARLLGQPVPRRLVPVVEVREGPLTLQRAAAIAGAAPEVELADLDAMLRGLAGGPYDPVALESVQRQVVERHRRAGYLQVDARVHNEEHEGHAVTSIVAVEPGPLVLLRSVVTRGLRLTRPSLVRRELDLVRGAPLSSTALDDARRQLYDLGIFASVGTTLLGEGTARDLLVTVQERKRWAAEAGGGINTDQGARVIGRLTRRNLFGLAHRVDAYGLVGVDYISDSVTDWRPDLRNLEWRGGVSYTAPHTPMRNNDLVFDLLLQERRQERTWRMARTGLGITLDTALGAHTSVQNTARIEVRNLQEVDRRALIAGEPWQVLTDDPDAVLAACYPCRLATTLQTVLLHDRRNDPVQPSRGFLVSGIAEISPAVGFQAPELNAPFVKAEGRLAGFVPLGGPILQLSGEGGLARGLGGAVVPLEDRFRLGGTGSMRGFRRQTVGPRNQAQRVDVDWPDGLAPVLDVSGRDTRDRWVPTGGDTTGVATAELLLPLPALGMPGWEGYAGALFADVGNVWQLGSGEPTTKSLAGVPALRYGIGAGVRIATPVGPLQLDVASNVQAATARGARRDLLVRAWEEPPLRAHLSLGTLW
ncbi:MAG: BamA/TamA family outer membrane protein [Alphaproteobacteria bacterium]|nr:BamA/TamA family outer membrane protein [Alphaproteobacteria bacterium]MCB9692547.1 BamA/TamA family outer membrane protein [Alphaproteobacteria bacterium]